MGKFIKFLGLGVALIIAVLLFLQNVLEVELGNIPDAGNYFIVCVPMFLSFLWIYNPDISSRSGLIECIIAALIIFGVVLHKVLVEITDVSIMLGFFAAFSIFIYIVYRLLFWATHREPLTDEQVEQLSQGRKKAYINEHFTFARSGVGANENYRASLSPAGRWDRVDIPLANVFSFAADLLRYKRHEWWVLCIADDETVHFLWANKGEDNSSCYFSGSYRDVVILAEQNQCHTLILIHNHPHTQARYWNLLSPSDTDKESMRLLSETFDEIGYNLIDGLCSQGRFIIYGHSFSKDYFPPGSSIEEIKQENGISRQQNYKLHRELRKLKRIKIRTNLVG